MEIITVDELISRLKKYNHKELHVHHTWRPRKKDFNGKNHLELQKNMRKYHIETRKFVDIAQHVTLMPDGLFVTGRDFALAPASISGYNTGAFCVEMLGDFDIGQEKLEGKQKESILKLAKFFYDRGKYIRFHRENAPKTCPGSGIDKTVFMNEVKNFGSKPAPTIDDLRKSINMVKLSATQIKYAEDAIKSLAGDGVISNPDEWIQKVRQDPVKVIEEFPWLIWVMFERMNNKINKYIKK